ncbi:UNVERIFIED_CONTAM: hypothetical protein GTU68_016700 [Idotea baltica]|nr:hypothetical protein [Idotea baltica]
MTKIGQQGQQVIQVPARPNQQPGVFYVNYNDGDNPDLGGVRLQDILAQQGQQGQVVGGGRGSGFGGGNAFVNGGGSGSGFVSGAGFGSGSGEGGYY